mgnify:CR=1 FL=1
MAVINTGLSTGTFAPHQSISKPQDQTKYEIHHGGKIFHQIDLKFSKIEPNDYIKWCRRNFGDRGDGWDFTGGGKIVDVLIWSSKLITMWEIWQE